MTSSTFYDHPVYQQQRNIFYLVKGCMLFYLSGWRTALRRTRNYQKRVIVWSLIIYKNWQGRGKWFTYTALCCISSFCWPNDLKLLLWCSRSLEIWDVKCSFACICTWWTVWWWKIGKNCCIHYNEYCFNFVLNIMSLF